MKAATWFVAVQELGLGIQYSSDRTFVESGPSRHLTGGNQMNWKRLCFTMSLSALCVVYNALSVDAQTCDPNLTYPNNPPGSEGGCGDYEDCNENGAFDIGEPCHEHHADDD